MNQSLIDSLFEKYPNLFVKTEAITCEDGWFDIIDEMCQKIQDYIDKEEEVQTRIFKIVNLYGGLHINAFTDSCEVIEDYIEEAEAKASSTCEFTGLPGELHCRGSLYHVTTARKAKELSLTLCNLHRIPGLG
jgi:diaminopimelate decarboxylase